MSKTLVPVERVQKSILNIRGEKVILDADLAALYGVSTKRLNEQVKRNHVRFPADFTFQLTSDEKAEVVANCDHLTRLKFSPNLPYAFTEHGTIMQLTFSTANARSTQASRSFALLLAYDSYSHRMQNSRAGLMNSRTSMIANSKLCSKRLGNSCRRPHSKISKLVFARDQTRAQAKV